MIPEQNLDEDILQCRAEILRSLGQDLDEEEKDSSPQEVRSSNPVDTAVTEINADLADPEESADSRQHKELIEDWIEADGSSSNSDSFESISITAGDLLQQPQQDEPASREIPPESEAAESQEPPIKEAMREEKNTPLPAIDIEQYNRTLNLLKMQKENLSQTCKDQETHIADLTQQTEQIRMQYQQAQAKITDLSSQVSRLSEVQKISERLKAKLDEATEVTEQLHKERGVLQKQHQEILEKKAAQIDSLLQKTAELENLTKELETAKTRITEEAVKNQSLLQQIEELEKQVQRHAGRLNQLEPLEAQIDSLKKELEESEKASSRFNLELEQLRQEKISLQEQVHSFEQGISKQQTDSQKAVSALQEEMIRKEQQIEHWRSQHDLLAEQLADAQEQLQMQTSEDITEEESPIRFHIEQELQTEQEKTKETEAGIPRFDLSEQILAAQRQQNSIRRQPPSGGRITPTANVKKVVEQFVTPSAEIRDHTPAVSRPVPKSAPAIRPAESHRQGQWSRDEGQSPIADIVRRDIESFCRQNQWIMIEFPSG